MLADLLEGTPVNCVKGMTSPKLLHGGGGVRKLEDWAMFETS